MASARMDKARGCEGLRKGKSSRRAGGKDGGGFAKESNGPN